MANNMNVKKDDLVIVISGNSRGVKGKVIEVSPKEGKVIVEGANKIKKSVKPRNEQEQGGIIETEGAMYVSKVQLFCEKCGKPTRASHKIDGDKKIRVCAKCGAAL